MTDVAVTIEPGFTPGPAEIPPDIARVLDAVAACPQRGRLVEQGDGCPCGPTYLCLRDTRVVGQFDCVACRCEALGVT